MKNVLMSDYHHIDNGGVTVSVIDHGVDEGIVLAISAEYHGYPAVESRIRIESLGPDWLKDIGLKFIQASQKISEIDFEKRYDAVPRKTSKMRKDKSGKIEVLDKKGNVISKQG